MQKYISPIQDSKINSCCFLLLVSKNASQHQNLFCNTLQIRYSSIGFGWTSADLCCFK